MVYALLKFVPQQCFPVSAVLELPVFAKKTSPPEIRRQGVF